MNPRPRTVLFTLAPLSRPALPNRPDWSGTIERGHILEKIVAGNEPVVSGGLGSLVMTHNDEDAM
jgi:hypothetical protein